VAALGGSSASGGNGGAVATGGASACPVGSERCDCYGNGTCNQGLECRSNLCVAAGNGGASSIGGDTGNGGFTSSQSSGGVESGGTTTGNVGGDSAPGGAVATGGVSNGGATDSGGMKSNGGTSNNGGATNSGGTHSNGGTATGGVSPTAGTRATGGTPSVGGNSSTNAAGSQAVGGLSSPGGSNAVGGTSNGGVPSTGGAASTCGDGVVQAWESCDPLPKNNDLGDGCTPQCQAEPNCPPSGGPCTSRCGDGLVLGSEACDDGNLVNGDGCSSDCTVEAGYTCSQPPLGDTMVVPMVVRDFDFKTGGDFEKGSGFSTGLYYATQGLLQGTLDSNGLKPVLASTKGTYNGTSGRDSGIASAASFAQWYDDAAPPSGNTYHATLATSLKLFLNKDGSAYVNRYGNYGDGATNAQFLQLSGVGYHYCGTVGKEDHDAEGNAIPCTSCLFDEDTSTPQCDPAPDSTDCTRDPSYVQCTKSGSYWYATYVVAVYDGNPLFFPADAIAKPWSPDTTAQISGNYDASWPTDPVSGRTHNFSFTTEVRFWFQYDASKAYKLTFAGDDDFWVFINKQLAVDIGGIHTAVVGALSIDSGTGSTTVSVSPTNVSPAPAPITSHPALGLEDGNIYEIAIFQAERQTKASSYMLSLAGFNTAPSVCTPD
jgi:fibro-slime domain-containing protein